MEENKENTIKRFYTGWRAIKNAILSHCKDGQSVDLTAVEIATAGNFNPKSVRISAKRLGIKLKTDKRGGARTPSNQHSKKSDLSKEKPTISP
jgi:hypothetical protein